LALGARYATRGLGCRRVETCVAWEAASAFSGILIRALRAVVTLRGVELGLEGARQTRRADVLALRASDSAGGAGQADGTVQIRCMVTKVATGAVRRTHVCSGGADRELAAVTWVTSGSACQRLERSGGAREALLRRSTFLIHVRSLGTQQALRTVGQRCGRISTQWTGAACRNSGVEVERAGRTR